MSLSHHNDGKLAMSDVSFWPDYMLKRLSHALVEFVTHMKQQQDAPGLKPTTIQKNYYLALQRGSKKIKCSII